MQLLTLASRPLLVALALGLAALFALPQTCFACSCAIPKPPLEAAADANAVFRAQVLTFERPGGSQRYQYQRATVRVTSVWKGSVTAETTIYTGSGGGDCGYTFQPGGEYLIYAYTIKEPTGMRDWPVGGLATSICTRTATIDHAAADLAALGPGQPPTPGLPNTGAGSGPAQAAAPLIPAEFLIAGGLLAFLAVAWRDRRSDHRRA